MYHHFTELLAKQTVANSFCFFCLSDSAGSRARSSPSATPTTATTTTTSAASRTARDQQHFHALGPCKYHRIVVIFTFCCDVVSQPSCLIVRYYSVYMTSIPSLTCCCFRCFSDRAGSRTRSPRRPGDSSSSTSGSAPHSSASHGVPPWRQSRHRRPRQREQRGEGPRRKHNIFHGITSLNIFFLLLDVMS